jgi:hypothetical protein
MTTLPKTRRHLSRWLLLGLILSATGCGGVNGCSTGGATPYPAEGLKVNSAIQAHITEAGFDSLEAAIVPLLASQVPGGTGSADTISICIPRTDSSGFILCVGSFCADQTEGCQFDLKVDNVQINPINNGPGTAQAQSPDDLEVVVTVRELNETIPVKWNVISCEINASLDPAQNDELTLEAEIELKINSTNERLELALLDGRTGVNLDDLRIRSTGLCAITNFSFVQDLIKSQVNTLLRPIIKDAADSALCESCDAETACPTNSTCNDKGLCISDFGGECIKKQFGTEGFFALGDTLSAFAPEIGDGGLAYTVYPANYADAALGTGSLSLGVQAGFTSAHNDCVAYFPPPSAQPLMRSPELEAINTPAGEPFHMGIGVSKRILDHALWAAYNTGALCIEVGTSSVEQISSGTLTVFLRSIGRLTGNTNVPVSLRLFPRKPPTMRLGAGTTEVVDGEVRLVEPLLTLELYDLDIDAYVFLFGRYARIFTINADIDVPLGITTTDAGELQILLGAADQLFKRVEVRNNELLSESKDDIAALIPSLIDNFLPVLLDSLAAPIALPDLLGFRLNIIQTTGIGNNTIMGLFARLDYVPPAGGLGMRADTDARLIGLDAPIKGYLKADGSLDWDRARDKLLSLTPRAELALSARVPAGMEAQVEYSYRVDGGLWSLWSPSERLSLAHPSFLMPGQHRVDVRSRVSDVANSIDLVPARVELLIDWAPPQVLRIDADDTQGAAIIAVDDVDAPSALQYRSRVDQGTWSAWSASNAVDLSAYADQRVRLEVEVTDRAGNTATAHRGITLRTQQQPLAEAPAAAAAPAAEAPAGRPSADLPTGCSVSRAPAAGSSSGTPWGALLSVVTAAAFGAVVRRRRLSAARSAARALPFLSLIALSLTLGACDDDTSAEGEDPCANDACADVVDGPCQSNDQCDAGQVCRVGVCGPADLCADDAACQEGQTCADTNGDGSKECSFTACADVSACAGVTCDGDNIAKCFQEACICELPCKDGCPDDQFCCNSQDTCQPLPDPCVGFTCEPGFRPIVESLGTPDPNACVVNNGRCGCEELPPLDIGIHGIDSSVASNATTVAAACYNRTYGDLMVGVAPVAGGDLTWSFIDGVPAFSASLVEGSLNGPRGGIARPGDNLGRYTSIAVADDGALHVSYQDVDATALKYALGTPDAAGAYTWTSHVIDDAGETGAWTSIGLHPTTGAPVIAYSTLDDEGVSRLRIASAASAAPAAMTDWALATVDESPLTGPCGEVCAADTFCRLDTGACEAIAAADAPCTTACAANERCFAGDTCAPTAWIAPSAVPDWSYSVAIHNRLLFDADGLARVFYHDSQRGTLKVARAQADASFAIETLVSDSKRAGLWPSATLDDAGGEHVVFTDWGTRSVRYLDVASALPPEVVHDGRRYDGTTFTGKMFLGADARLWLQGGSPRVVFQNASDMVISLSERSATDGAWTTSVLEGSGRDASFTGSHGFFLGHTQRDGKDFFINMVINSQVDGRPIAPKLHTHELP